MNFSINSICKPTPSFTALKFTYSMANFDNLSSQEIETLKQIKDEQKDFKHVDVEVGRFINRNRMQPYFPNSTKPYDVVVNTRYAMAYTNIHEAKASGNTVKINCDEHNKHYTATYYNSVATYQVKDSKTAKNFTNRMNSTLNQIEKAKIFAELIETSDKPKEVARTESIQTDNANKEIVQNLIDSCKRV